MKMAEDKQRKKAPLKADGGIDLASLKSRKMVSVTEPRE